MSSAISVTQFSKTGKRPKKLPALPDKTSPAHYLWVSGSKDSQILNDYFIGTNEINIEAAMFLFSDKRINEPDINSDYAVIATHCYQSSRWKMSHKIAKFRVFLDDNHVITLLDSDFEGLDQLWLSLKTRLSPPTTGRLFACMLKILVRNIKFHITHLKRHTEDLESALDTQETPKAEVDRDIARTEEENALRSLKQLRRDVTSIAQAQYDWTDRKSLRMIWNSIAYMERIERSVEALTIKPKRSWFGRRKK